MTRVVCYIHCYMLHFLLEEIRYYASGHGILLELGLGESGEGGGEIADGKRISM